jgi:hypothetical protein
MVKVNMKTRRKVRNTLLTAVVLGIMIVSTGCQAASDLFNPDTYNFYNTEPWERNQKKKVAKPKTLKDQM